jgi:uncharacterized membrane protein YgdD (TMEM256/DUF423 family)
MISFLPRLWLGLGALAGLLAVALSAWAAHGANPAIRPLLDSALTMQGWHALALLATALWAERRGGWLPHAAAAAFALGLLCFCGALYTLALAGRSLGPVAPLGGSALMLGWALLLASALRR